MRRYLFLFISVVSIVQLWAQSRDSLYRICQMAADGRMEGIRDFVDEHRFSIPTGERLFLEWHLAREVNNRERMRSAGDSLLADTSGMFVSYRPILACENIRSLVSMNLTDSALAYARYVEKHTPPVARNYWACQFEHYRILLERMSSASVAESRIWAACMENSQAMEEVLVWDTGQDGDRLHSLAGSWRSLYRNWQLGKRKDALRDAEQIVQNYGTELTPIEQLELAFIHCQLLESEGHYAEMAQRAIRTMREVQLDSSAYDRWWLNQYKQVGLLLAKTPCPVIERPDTLVRIPLHHKGWPLQVRCKLNGCDMGLVTIDTGAMSSLIDRESARRFGVRMLPVVTYVSSYLGTHKCRFAVVDSMSIGDITFRNRLVRVIDDDSWNHPAQVGTLLGMNELIDMGIIDIYDDRLELPLSAEASSVSPNFCMGRFPGVLFRANVGGRVHTFNFDTGSAALFIDKKCFPLYGPEQDFVLDTDFGAVSMGRNVYWNKDGSNTSYDGLLGMPFVTRFDRFRINFQAMRLEGYGVRPLKHDLGILINSGDFFKLEQTRKEWDTSNPFLVDLASLFVAYGKNCPDSVIVLVRRLSEKYKEKIDQQLRTSLGALLANALLDAGYYARAARVLRGFLGQIAVADQQDGIRKKLNLAECLSLQPATEAVYGKNAKSPKCVSGPDGKLRVEARINGKKAIMGLNPSVPYCILPVGLADRLNTKRLSVYFNAESGDSVWIGVVPRLQLGGVVLSHVVCEIVPRDVLPSIGLQVLRLLPPFECSSTGMKYLSSGIEEGIPLRLENNRLYVPITHEGFAWKCMWTGDDEICLSQRVQNLETLYMGSMELHPYLSQGKRLSDGMRQSASLTVGLDAILRQGVTLKFDFSAMRMEISR